MNDADVVVVRPRRHWGRGVALVLFALLGAVALAIAWGESTGWTLLRAPLERWATRSANVPVRLGEPFRLSLFVEPSVALGRLTVGAPRDVPAEHLLDANELEARWRWRDLWAAWGGQPPRLVSLSARTLDLRLLRLADGRASWHIGRPRRADDTRPSARLPQFDALSLTEGRVRIDDRVLDTQLSVEIAGVDSDDAEQRRTRGDIGYRASVRGKWRTLPLELQATSGSALPLLREGRPGAAAPRLSLRVQGRAGAARLLFDGWAADALGARQIDGELQFAGPSLAQVGAPLGLTLPQTPAFELAGRIAHDRGVWRLQAGRAEIGRSQLAGDFVYDSRTQPGKLTGTLTGPRLALADLGPAVGAPTGGAPERPTTAVAPPKTPARVLPERRFDLPSLRGMDADVRVAIDELDFGSKAMAPMRGLRTQVLLQAGVLRMPDLRAQVAGGALSGSTVLDGTREPAQWDARLRFGNVDISGWLRGLRAPAGRADATGMSPPGRPKGEYRSAQHEGTPVRAYLTGRLDARVDVTGQGRSTAEILGSLDGRARLVLRDASLSHLVTEAAGLDLAEALGVVVRGDRALPLRCADMALTLRDGVAHMQHAVIDNSDSTIRMRGSVNLRDETLAVAARAQSKDFSPLSLRSPITVTGTLSQPRLGIEGRKVAGRVLGALAIGAVVAPVAALVPLIDPGRRDAPDPCAVAAAAP